MIRELILTGTLASAFLLRGAEKNWDYNRELPDAWNSVSVQVAKGEKTPAGGVPLLLTAGYDASELRWPPFLVYPEPGSLIEPGAEVTIRCYARATRPLKVSWRITQNAPASTHYSKTVTLDIETEWKELVYRERVYDARPTFVINCPRMLFNDIRKSDKVWLGPLSITVNAAGKTTDAAAISSSAPVEVSQPGVWKTIDVSDLYIKPGSALDLSGVAERVPAGSFGRLVVDESGVPYFEKRPGVPARFFSVQLIPDMLPSWSKGDIDNYAAAVARQGYNLVRFHFLDNVLQGSTRAPALKAPAAAEYKLPQTPKEVKFIPGNLDRFDYLVAALRRNGVYINMDAMTSYIGYDSGMNGERDKKGAFMTKIQMFINPMFRRNWKAGVDKLFSHVNPYTGLSLKEDPAVVLVSFLNEQEVLPEFRDYSIPFHPAWAAFLKKKYGTYDKLFEAWDGQCGGMAIPADGKFETLPGIIYKIASGSSRAGRDMTECIAAMESEMTDFYLKAIREIGYPGLVTNWNMRTRIATVPARSKLPAVSMNGYHCHPQDGYNSSGTTVDNSSAVENVGNSFKHQAVARFADRPFFNTEFGFCFWNPTRHEQGLVFGAGAALQGWTSITCHAGQVQETGNFLVPFAAGADPVIRAAEVVEAFTYLRGDVKTSPHLVEIPLDDRFIFSGQALRGVSDELSRIWTLCKVGISYGGKLGKIKPDLVVFPEQTSQLGGTDMFTSVESTVTSARIRPVVEKLRGQGVLPASNRTDPEQGVYQSDTGEIILNTNGVMQVATPRFAGVTIKEDGAYDLGAVNISGCSVPAAVSVISLSKEEEIPQAKRLLVVFATDALNNRMAFQSPDRKKLVRIGELPVLWRTGTLSFSVAAPGAKGEPKLYALKLNGERAEEIPVKKNGERLEAVIDTAQLATQTPFFELKTGR